MAGMCIYKSIVFGEVSSYKRARWETISLSSLSCSFTFRQDLNFVRKTSACGAKAVFALKRECLSLLVTMIIVVIITLRIFNALSPMSGFGIVFLIPRFEIHYHTSEHEVVVWTLFRFSSMRK